MENVQRRYNKALLEACGLPTKHLDLIGPQLLQWTVVLQAEELKKHTKFSQKNRIELTVCGARDTAATSVYTGVKATPNIKPWMMEFEEETRSTS